MRVIRSRSPVVLVRSPRQAGKSDAMRCDAVKIGFWFFTRNDFFWKFFFGAIDSHLVILDLRRFASIIGDVDDEVGEESGCFALEQPERGHREAPDLELRALAGP